MPNIKKTERLQIFYFSNGAFFQPKQKQVYKYLLCPAGLPIQHLFHRFMFEQEYSCN
jgi:hypothetical protein